MAEEVRKRRKRSTPRRASLSPPPVDDENNDPTWAPSDRSQDDDPDECATSVNTPRPSTPEREAAYAEARVSDGDADEHPRPYTLFPDDDDYPSPPVIDIEALMRAEEEQGLPLLRHMMSVGGAAGLGRMYRVSGALHPAGGDWAYGVAGMHPRILFHRPYRETSHMYTDMRAASMEAATAAERMRLAMEAATAADRMRAAMEAATARSVRRTPRANDVLRQDVLLPTKEEIEAEKRSAETIEPTVAVEGKNRCSVCLRAPAAWVAIDCRCGKPSMCAQCAHAYIYPYASQQTAHEPACVLCRGPCPLGYQHVG